MSKLYKYLLPVVIFLNINAYAQTDNAVKATVNKREVATGEIFTYTLEVEGQFHSPKLRLPGFENFIIASQNQQRRYTAKGNGTFLTIKAVYNLFAPKPGSFTIGKASVTDEAKTIESQPIIIEVSGKPLEEKKKLTPYLQKGIDL